MSNPRTLEECMVALNDLLSKEDLAEFIKMSKDDVGRHHHGLGQWIRNHWGLWQGGELLEHMKSLGFIHPDDMSHSIMTEYWNRLHNEPSQIKEDVQYYKEYWEKSKHGS
jgi:hypothetical protein